MKYMREIYDVLRMIIITFTNNISFLVLFGIILINLLNQRLIGMSDKESVSKERVSGFYTRFFTLIKCI